MLAARVLLGLTTGFCLYTYLGYPAILKLLSLLGRTRREKRAVPEWPRISIALPVYNEADVIASTLERILSLDYPADRRQILVVSDASNDRTDEIVSRFADRGVELLRLPRRQGKTAAENVARPHLTGEIVVNTDASVRIHPAAVRHLVARFAVLQARPFDPDTLCHVRLHAVHSQILPLARPVGDAGRARRPEYPGVGLGVGPSGARRLRRAGPLGRDWLAVA